MPKSLSVSNKKKELPPIILKKNEPTYLFLPKSEVLKRNKAAKKARIAAEVAYQEELAKQLGTENVELKQADIAVTKQRQLVATLTKAINSDEEELKHITPGEGEKIPLKSSISKNKSKLEIAKEKLVEIEENYEKVKAQEEK